MTKYIFFWKVKSYAYFFKKFLKEKNGWTSIKFCNSKLYLNTILKNAQFNATYLVLTFVRIDYRFSLIYSVQFLSLTSLLHPVTKPYVHPFKHRQAKRIINKVASSHDGTNVILTKSHWPFACILYVKRKKSLRMFVK